MPNPMPPPPDIAILPATLADAQDVAALVNAAYRPSPGAGGWTHESLIISGDRIDVEQITAALADSTVFVARWRNACVACVQVDVSGEEAHIGMLAVAPSLQERGWGKRMLQHAEAYARSIASVQQLVLSVVATRAELIAFYRRRGYETTGQVLPYPADRGVGVPLTNDMSLVVLRKNALS